MKPWSGLRCAVCKKRLMSKDALQTGVCHPPQGARWTTHCQKARGAVLAWVAYWPSAERYSDVFGLMDQAHSEALGLAPVSPWTMFPVGGGQ